MSSIKDWYQEAKKRTLVHTEADKTFVIYKGFKITKSEDSYSILYTRSSDFYTEISDAQRRIFIKEGFVEGARRLSHIRNKRRVKYYQDKMKRLYTKKKGYEKGGKAAIKKNAIKISNCEDGILSANNLRAFYQTQIDNY